MPPIQQLTRQLRRRIVIGEFLRLAGRWVAMFLLILGIVVLGVKLFAPDYWPRILWLGLGLPILCGWLSHRARGAAPSGWRLIGLLDDRLAAGGLLMTLSERPDPRWDSHLPDVDRGRDLLPSIIPEPFARAIVIPVMFLGGALALPSRDAVPPPSRASLANDVSTELEEGLSVLQGNQAIDPATAARLASEIAQLTGSLDEGSLTHESWGTIDALRGKMRSALDLTDQSLLQGEIAVSAILNSLAGGETPSSDELARLARELESAVSALDDKGASAESLRGAEELLEAASSAGLREILNNPAAREMALRAMQSRFTEQRRELEQTRAQFARTFGETPPASITPSPAGMDVARSPSDGRSTFQMRALAGAAGELGGAISDRAAALGEALFPVNVLAPLIHNANGSRATADRSDGARRDDPAEIESASMETVAPARSTAPVDVFSQSPTWTRELRPRHREVVRGYFRGG